MAGSGAVIVLVFFGGVLLGFGVAWLVFRGRAATAKALVEEIFRENERLREEERRTLEDRLKAAFGDVSHDVLKKSTEQFLSLAGERFESERKLHGRDLETKKSLIDQQLQRMVSELDKVAGVVKELEKDRENKFGELTKQLEETGKRTGELIRTTNTLKEALASSKSRGQWGERMAEDVLRIAGFVEKVNYEKQATLEESGGRPDFTFFLPRDRKLNMDVKFPYDNYIRYIESESDSDREQFRKQFLRDVRLRIKEVASREYIDPDGQKTVDYVLLFIPNEQIYAFINEQDAAILDDGIKSKVILCSPVTLFAVLAVIRAAVENFALEQTSNRILDLLGKFGRQWGKFVESFDKLGRWIDKSQMEYANLLTTRKRQLERPLGEIEELRRQREIDSDDSDDRTLTE